MSQIIHEPEKKEQRSEQGNETNGSSCLMPVNGAQIEEIPHFLKLFFFLTDATLIETISNNSHCQESKPKCSSNWKLADTYVTYMNLSHLDLSGLLSRERFYGPWLHALANQHACIQKTKNKKTTRLVNTESMVTENH